jgi:hypothetical protein
VGVFDFDFHGHTPTVEFHEFDVSEEFNLKFPEGLCSASIHLVESMDELFAVCIFYVDFDPSNISAAHILKIEEIYGEELVA